ncbi:mucin-17 [Aplysia californica]|uniref:Mucin-17 n=1 Tax=Aplysia californica TaxID=6500 RepID=A0ABM0ZUC2_APLCA|nr:mucin-17 [Aplysia californica]
MRSRNILVLAICALTLPYALCQAENGELGEMEQLKRLIGALSRQVMLQQVAAEEKVRSDGASGIKQVRATSSGPLTYNVNAHTASGVASIHDHTNNRITLGQGEGVFVLNGVEFRTRHNDYPLRMASRKSKKYNVVQEVKFPDVPPEVLNKTTVQEQVDEMREWLKAWRDQDHSERDYRKYFKPVLCYLEGGWTTKTDQLEEPFHSDRHSLDADSWFDLQEKIRFTSYTGRKSMEENFAYLPTTIINITASGIPVFAQWNYRILCHPLSRDLPTSYLKLVDDLGVRMARRFTMERLKVSRAARYRVQGPKDHLPRAWAELDRLMSEIPGRDNYPADITDDAFGTTFYHPGKENDTAMNVGFYHRSYKVGKADAMGLKYGRRGFSDPNLFVAETTQPRVAPLYLRQCKRKVCHETTKRMTYAIPLEIVYLTPLHQWNPYNLTLRPKAQRSVVTESGKRNGKFTPDKAYNGSYHSIYYRIPTELFTGREVGKDPADTVRGSVGVLDDEGIVRRVSASGMRVILPNIPGVGPLRTRYPIMPVHGEGGSVWKELNALKDIVLQMKTKQAYLYEKPIFQQRSSTAPPTQPARKRWQKTTNRGRGTTPRGSRRTSPTQTTPTKGRGTTKNSRRGRPAKVTTPITALEATLTPPEVEDGAPALSLVMSTATLDPPGEHSHTVDLTADEIDSLKTGGTVITVSSEDNGHAHSVHVKYYDGRYHVVLCDGSQLPCWDGHGPCLMRKMDKSCPKETVESVSSTTSTPTTPKVDKDPGTDGTRVATPTTVSLAEATTSDLASKASTTLGRDSVTNSNDQESSVSNPSTTTITSTDTESKTTSSSTPGVSSGANPTILIPSVETLLESVSPSRAHVSPTTKSLSRDTLFALTVKSLSTPTVTSTLGSTKESETSSTTNLQQLKFGSGFIIESNRHDTPTTVTTETTSIKSTDSIDSKGHDTSTTDTRTSTSIKPTDSPNPCAQSSDVNCSEVSVPPLSSESPETPTQSSPTSPTDLTPSQTSEQASHSSSGIVPDPSSFPPSSSSSSPSSSSSSFSSSTATSGTPTPESGMTNELTSQQDTRGRLNNNNFRLPPGTTSFTGVTPPQSGWNSLSNRIPRRERPSAVNNRQFPSRPYDTPGTFWRNLFRGWTGH